MGLAVALATWSMPASSADDRVEYELQIESQPLGTALQEFSKQSGVQVVFLSRIADGLAAPEVKGKFTADGALKRLLNQSELTFRELNANTIEVQRKRETGAQALAGPDRIRLAQANSDQQASNDAEPAAQADLAVLEEVTVTAEKISRSLLDTATSIAVFDANTLAKRPGLESMNDLLARISNVVDTGTTNLMPAVRGVDGTGPANGRDAFLGGTRPRLAIQLDGRPLSYNESVFGDSGLWDVQQAEFLRGPQSSLQGRNSVGGLLAIKTQDPTFDWQAGGRVLAGTDQARTGSLFVSGPLGDQLAFRVAFDHQEHTSWIPMADYDATYFDNPPAPPEQIGNYYYDPSLQLIGDSKDFIRDAGDFRATTARLKLLFKPMALEGFTSLLTVNHADYSAPQGEWVYKADEAITAFSIPPGIFKTKHGFIDSYPTFNARFNPRVTSTTLDSRWERSDALSFESTISYANVNTRRISKQGDGNLSIDAKEFMVEPRVRFGAKGDRITGLAGVYYFHNKQDEYIDFGFAAGPYDDKTTTAAAFTEVTFAATDQLDFTLGARYEDEKRRRVGQAFFTVDFDAEYKVFMPKAVVSWKPTERSTLGAAVNRGYNGGGAAFTFDPPFLNYEYGEERVWNYEAFYRSDLLGNRLRLTANAFFTRYDNFQMPYDLNPGPAYAIVIINAQEVQTRGLELGLTAVPATGWELFADLGLLDTEVTKYPGGQVLEGNVLPPSEFEGNELARSPKLSAKFGTSYKHRSGFDFGLDFSYSGSYYSSIVNREDEKVSSFLIANAQVGYEIGNVRLFGYVRNLFDKRDPLFIERASYDLDYNGTTDVSDIATYAILPPRTIMAGVQVKF